MTGDMRRLVITRPLVFFDLETTGVDPRNDRIVEISLLKAFPPDTSGNVPEPLVKTRRVNPGMPIPPGATAIHHITDADVADEPSFEKIARSLYDLLQECDFAGFGVRRYDLPLLAAEFKRAGLDFVYKGAHVIDGKDIFHHKEPRTLSAAYALYCGGELKSAHSAEADMLASRDVILAQLERYEDLPTDVAALATVGAPAADPDAFDSEGKLKWIGDDVVLNFGKARGKSLRELSGGDRGLLEWILRSDFSDETKTAVRNALAGRFPVRGQAVSRAFGLLQSGLFVLFAGLYLFDPSPRVAGGEPVMVVAGDVLSLAGVVLLFVALRTIGKSIQIEPAPRADATLVTHGVYRVLRHPIYTAIVIILIGLVARGATPAAAVAAAATIAFLLVKARYEEKLLGAHYPEYEAYRKATRGVLF